MKTAAVILAGGLGTRVRRVLGDCPKALAPVNGTPFLSFLLDQLAEVGAAQVIVSAGPWGDRVQRAIELRRDKIPVVILPEDWPMGTGGALRQAIRHVDASVETVLVLNGDSYLDTDLVQFCEWQRTHAFQTAILLTRTENCAQNRTVELDPAGRILAFREHAGLPRPGWIDGGVYLLSRAWLEELPANIPVSLERDAFPYWIGRGIGGYCVFAPFLDIGTPAGLARAPAFFTSRKSRYPIKALRA
jgi:NDP-sugar pyrophosphorylase family protein